MKKLYTIFAFLAALFCGTAALAQSTDNLAAPMASPPADPGRLTANDAETWLDGFMPYALDRGGVAGGVVVIVKDGAVLLEKGYGLSDVAARTPVDPKTTLFRPGSVSKLFTWTAVMQLVEAGKLDLDTDVNQYLDFKIPPRNGRPITLRNLLTHTAGFEDRMAGLIVEDIKDVLPLGDALKKRMPERVYDAGTTPAYSNYGSGLAGYIVERISGEPFDAYIERHIFAPLHMHHSSFRQPLEPALLATVSKGYEDASKPPKPYELLGIPPAGGLAATGDDMAQFMIAHLQDGRYGSTQILKPQTARQMHSTALILMPPLNGIELGFYEQNMNGHRVIAHGGDTVLFHSYLYLFLDDHVGLFISVNSAGKDEAAGAIRQHLLEAFSDRYLPTADTDGRVADTVAAAHAKMFVGTYANSRRSHSNFRVAADLFRPAVRALSNPDGTLSITGMNDFSGEPQHYREIEPFVWRAVGGHERLGALVKDGRVVRLATDAWSSVTVFDAVPAWRSAALLEPAFLASSLALLLTALAWPAGALVRRYCSVPFQLVGESARAHRLMRWAAAAIVAALAGWAWVIPQLDQGIAGLLVLVHAQGLIHAIQLLTILSFIGGFSVAVYHLFVVWSRPSGWFARIWSVALVLSTLTLLWVGWAYELISLSTNF